MRRFLASAGIGIVVVLVGRREDTGGGGIFLQTIGDLRGGNATQVFLGTIRVFLALDVSKMG